MMRSGLTWPCNGRTRETSRMQNVTARYSFGLLEFMVKHALAENDPELLRID